ncbi:hypothetical protein SXCC_04199 [Gluconacetobacter sp. SXCC-1]|nr:hypothetical protein SXCC_04199 [Gluconacetobacter sp. SXCC-1]
MIAKAAIAFPVRAPCNQGQPGPDGPFFFCHLQVCCRAEYHICQGIAMPPLT